MFGFGTPRYPELPTLSFICAAMILLPVTAHWKARNVATLSMIVWLFVINVTRFVNTLIWANNVIIRIPVWCDITTKLTIGVTIALPAAALCICRYLEAIASVRWARQTDRQKRNRMYFELFMCFGLPMIIMALHYISQGHRYDLYEHFGCQPTTVITWVALLILYVPPLVLSLIAFVYAALAVRHFYRRRLDFKRHLSASSAGITPSRYLRLMLLALTEMCFDSAINIWIIWINVSQWRGLVPWTGWADIHYNFSRIQPYPQALVPPQFWRQIMFTWYVIPIATVLFWIFFAFGQESIAEYKLWWSWIRRVILRRPVEPSSSQQGLMRVLPTNMGKISLSSPLDSSPNGSIPGGMKNFAKRISIAIPSARPKKKVVDDDESFISEEASSDMKNPISPLSPTEVPFTPALEKGKGLDNYTEPELDTSIFDTISHISVPDASTSSPTESRQGSLRQQQQQQQSNPGPYHPMFHHRESVAEPPAFANTAVRSHSPEFHTNEVRMEIESHIA